MRKTPPNVQQRANSPLSGASGWQFEATDGEGRATMSLLLLDVPSHENAANPERSDWSNHHRNIPNACVGVVCVGVVSGESEGCASEVKWLFKILRMSSISTKCEMNFLKKLGKAQSVMNLKNFVSGGSRSRNGEKYFLRGKFYKWWKCEAK